MRIATIIVTLALAFVAGWILMYPSATDPKNIKYVLWKADLFRINPDMAAAAMVGDPSRSTLVVGKTKSQIQNKFGDLLTLDKVSPYLRGCYQDSTWKGKDVLFIGQSPWMVVFDGDRATNLVLMKGC